MPAPWQTYITPAFISFLTTLISNRVFEAQRARRELITKLFEIAREDVRRASETAIEYFSIEPGARDLLQEAKVLAADRELRAAVPALFKWKHGGEDRLAYRSATSAYVSLIAELTGGNFQASSGDVDRDHVNRLVFACATMRSTLATLREDQLSMMIGVRGLVARYEELRSRISARYLVK